MVPMLVSSREAASAARPTIEACYRAHRDVIFHRCLRYGAGNVAFAEEVTHDAFVKLVEHLPSLADVEDLGGWLHRVAVNLAISRLRRERSWIGKVQALLFTSDASGHDTAIGSLERTQTAHRVLAALRELPPRERVVVCMKMLDGASQREIARALELSEGYVSKLFQRALRRLADAGWEVDDVQG